MVDGQETKIQRRGCGTRQDNSLYMTVPMGKDGQPIEYFLLDPVIPWKGRQVRAPLMETLDTPMPDGSVIPIKHVLIGIGAKYYPFVSDFVEEAGIMGISKKVSLNIDLTGLVPNVSRLMLIHPKAIAKFDYRRLQKRCPQFKVEEHRCIGDLWPLSSFHPALSSEIHELIIQSEPWLYDGIKVKTPSVKYLGMSKDDEIRLMFSDIINDKMVKELEYQAGIILRFPMFKFQFVSKSGNVPRKVAESFDASEYKLEVVPQ